MDRNIFIAIGIVLLGLFGGLVSSSIHAPTSPKTGGIGSPDIPFNYLQWGGVPQYVYGANLKTATTTPCNIQSPTATSTLVWAGIRVDTSSSTATIWDIAQAATLNATTTAIGTAYNVGANAAAFILASTSPGAGQPTVFAPSQWLVFGVRQGITGGDTAGTGFVPAGRCEAEFVAWPSY